MRTKQPPRHTAAQALRYWRESFAGLKKPKAAGPGQDQAAPEVTQDSDASPQDSSTPPRAEGGGR